MNKNIKFIFIATTGVLIGYFAWSIALPNRLGIEALVDPFNIIALIFAISVATISFAYANTRDR